MRYPSQTSIQVTACMCHPILPSKTPNNPTTSPDFGSVLNCMNSISQNFTLSNEPPKLLIVRCQCHAGPMPKSRLLFGRCRPQPTQPLATICNPVTCKDVHLSLVEVLHVGALAPKQGIPIRHLAIRPVDTQQAGNCNHLHAASSGAVLPLSIPDSSTCLRFDVGRRAVHLL
jgi:hypothetical protein